MKCTIKASRCTYFMLYVTLLTLSLHAQQDNLCVCVCVCVCVVCVCVCLEYRMSRAQVPTEAANFFFEK